MTEKTKVWRSDEWVCLLVNDGVSQSTVSLTASEATDLCDFLSAAIIGSWQHQLAALDKAAAERSALKKATGHV